MLARVRGGGGGGGGSPFHEWYEATCSSRCPARAVPAMSRVRVVLNSSQNTFLRSKVTQASPASEGSVSISACNRIGTSSFLYASFA